MGSRYELTVWGDDAIVCAICGKTRSHGIGVEGYKVDVDVCDDCAGGTIVARLDAMQSHRKAKAHWEWKTKKVSKQVKVTSLTKAATLVKRGQKR